MNASETIQSPPASTPATRIDVHVPFQEFPADTVIDEFFTQQEREGEFVKEVTRRMLDTMLEFKIWSESRPAQEIEQFGDQMDENLKTIQTREQEQGMSFLDRARQSLVAFVLSIQTALAALKNF